IKGNVYDRVSGKQIINFTPQEKKEISELAQKAKASLHYSDLLNNHNLLRFYTPTGFVPADPTQFDYSVNYQKMIAIRNELAGNSTSLYSRHRGTTTNLYRTDAAELKDRKQEITQVPDSVKNIKENKKNKNSSENTNN
ncbi:MAG: LTA synthase family protein, partial [Lactobacillus crispatus]|nr:LTA synthase family protein [Lactobacillus crispatus]MCT7714280.1 LTA synthase family protein [Lactobacillus crispatus]